MGIEMATLSGITADIRAIEDKSLHLEGGLAALGAHTFCAASSYLKKPVFFLIEQCIQTFWMPVIPGEFGQRSAQVEYTSRGLVLTLMALALLAPPGKWVMGAIVALAGSSALAIGLKLVASFMNTRDFFSMVQDEPKTLSGNSLHIVSANICAFEAGLSWVCGGLRPSGYRLGAIVDSLVNNEPPHVLALQEVWSHTVAMELIEALKKKGYTQFFFSMGMRPHAPGAGLFVASRVKMRDPEFVPFKADTTLDIKRGFFKATIDRGAEEGIPFVTTHLEPSKDDLNPTSADQVQRAAQLDQIQRNMEGKEAILCGDLNMLPQELGSLFGGAFASQNSEEPTCTQNFDRQLKNKPFAEEVRLDYMLATGALAGKFPRSDSIIPLYDPKASRRTSEALSDHQGISTVFTLN